MMEVESASTVATTRLHAICGQAGLTEEQRMMIERVTDRIIGRMHDQLRDASIASISFSEVAVALRSTDGLGGDLEASHMERAIVSAIIGRMAVAFRNKGYDVKSRYGIVVSLA